jgi:hypothetical protein
MMASDESHMPIPAASTEVGNPRRRLPNRRPHLALDFELDGMNYTAGLGLYGDGTPAELFLTAKRYGTAAGVAAGDAAVAVSFALQHGCPLDVLRRAALRNPDGSASGVLGRALDMIARELEAGND